MIARTGRETLYELVRKKPSTSSREECVKERKKKGRKGANKAVSINCNGRADIKKRPNSERRLLLRRERLKIEDRFRKMFSSN